MSGAIIGSRGFGRVKGCLGGLLTLGVALGGGGRAWGALVLHWEMDAPLPLADSAGANPLLDPGVTASPTHLAAGGEGRFRRLPVRRHRRPFLHCHPRRPQRHHPG